MSVRKPPQRYPMVVLLSRAARMEYDAGRAPTPGQRRLLLDDAYRLRREAGQASSVIESSQAYNVDRGERGLA